MVSIDSGLLCCVSGSRIVFSSLSAILYESFLLKKQSSTCCDMSAFFKYEITSDKFDIFAYNISLKFLQIFTMQVI